VPSQDVISRDNVSVKVNAILYFRIVDPERAIIKVENFMAATSQLAQTTLRSVLGKHELDEMLAERDRLNADIQTILDQQTDAWGIKVTNVESQLLSAPSLAISHSGQGASVRGVGRSRSMSLFKCNSTFLQLTTNCSQKVSMSGASLLINTLPGWRELVRSSF
jgi:hypothetical protein